MLISISVDDHTIQHLVNSVEKLHTSQVRSIDKLIVAMAEEITEKYLHEEYLNLEEYKEHTQA